MSHDRRVLALVAFPIGLCLASEALAAPAAPTPIAPTGAVTNPNPAFTWTASSGAYDYLLQTFDSTNTLLKQYAPLASSICSGSTCAYTPSYTLPIGSFSWTVKARDTNRQGGWSPRTAFSVVAPPAPVAIAPSGSIGTPTPTYTWNTSSGATSYAFEAFATDGTKVFFLIVDAVGACSGSTCAWTPGNTLTAGSYWWHVKGRHASGAGAWSATMNFTAQVPPAPPMGGPGGYTLDPMPTYYWTAAAGATGYTLETFDSVGASKFRTDYSSSSVCSGSSCAVKPDSTLAIDEYTWHVRGTNAIGGGAWSAAKAFSVNGPPAPAAVSPSGIVRLAQPTFSWQAASGATGYQLEVLKEDGTRRFIELSIPGTVCAGSSCAFISGQILAVGEYTWHVRGTHAGGGGAWSSLVAISIRGPAPPVLGSPNGNTYDPQPTYTWSASSGATSYRLQTSNSAGNNEYMVDYAASSVCDAAGACAARPGTALLAEQYSWHLRSIGSVGLGEWSAARAFSVLAPPAATLVSPAGHTYEATPVFTWTASPYATDYWLELFDVSDPDVGVSLLKRLVTAASVCSGTACSLAPDKGLASGPYRWYLIAKSAAGGTLASLDFTVLRPTAPTLLSPSGLTENASPTFTWTASTGATRYRLWIGREDGSTVWQGHVQTTSCSGGTCTGAPGKLLSPGTYVWNAVAQSSAGGTDGATMGFTVRRALTVVLLFPGGTLSDSTPTYTWRPTGATSYLLAVDDSGGETVTRLWYPASTSCTANVCLAQPGISLSIGHYNWFVQPADAGIQSNVKAFHIVETPLPSGDPSLPEEVHFYHADPLGSVRMVTNSSRSVIARYDYFPFGEQIPSTLSGRNSVPGYNLDAANKHRFTGKLRDFEGGALPLDYFGARYYSGAMGRFASPDPLMNVPADVIDPQRWNRYTYALNNPFRFVDPDGADPREALARYGEKLAAWQLRDLGYDIVLSGARKHVKGAGFDILAKKGSELLLVDNKAFLSRRTVSRASALTKNLAANVDSAIKELDALVRSGSLSEAETKAATEALEALEKGAFQRVVTGAGGIAERVGPRLARMGVSFKPIGLLALALDAILLDATNAAAAGETPFEDQLTSDEWTWHLKYRRGEDIFGRDEPAPPGQSGSCAAEYSKCPW